jgi:hypothetical protein
MGIARVVGLGHFNAISSIFESTGTRSINRNLMIVISVANPRTIVTGLTEWFELLSSPPKAHQLSTQLPLNAVAPTSTAVAVAIAGT